MNFVRAKSFCLRTIWPVFQCGSKISIKFSFCSSLVSARGFLELKTSRDREITSLVDIKSSAFCFDESTEKRKRRKTPINSSRDFQTENNVKMFEQAEEMDLYRKLKLKNHRIDKTKSKSNENQIPLDFRQTSTEENQSELFLTPDIEELQRKEKEIIQAMEIAQKVRTNFLCFVSLWKFFFYFTMKKGRRRFDEFWRKQSLKFSKLQAD